MQNSSSCRLRGIVDLSGSCVPLRLRALKGTSQKESPLWRLVLSELFKYDRNASFLIDGDTTSQAGAQRARFLKGSLDG